VIGCADVTLAPRGGRLYLKEGTLGRLTGRPPGLFIRTAAMAQPISTPSEPSSLLAPARKVASAIVIGFAGLGAVALVAALVLWFHYGTAVFFEMIAAGVSACF
jgi:hypothetical protein